MNNPVEIADGQPLTDLDEQLIAAQSRFTVDKQIELLQSTAQRVVGQIAIVGSVLAALGVVSATVVANSMTSKWLLYGAVGLALVAVLLALFTQTLRVSQLQVGNLLAVNEWFSRYTGWRRWFLSIATWMLVASFVLAMVAAAISVVSPPNPSLSGGLVVAQAAKDSPETYTATGEFRVMAARPDQTASITVRADNVVAASNLQAPAADGWITVKATAEGLKTGSAVTISATSAGWTCDMTLSADGTAPASTCTESTE